MTVSATARRLIAAALSVVAITAEIAVPASAVDHRPHRQAVEIGSVQYDAPGWVNRSNRSLDAELGGDHQQHPLLGEPGRLDPRG